MPGSGNRRAAGKMNSESTGISPSRESERRGIRRPSDHRRPSGSALGIRGGASYQASRVDQEKKSSGLRRAGPGARQRGARGGRRQDLARAYRAADRAAGRPRHLLVARDGLRQALPRV